MTTYNHEAYLAQAIESVLAQQTSFGVELVLGDDCSTDSTAAICREYAAKYPGRVRFVTGQRNVGWRANYRRTFEACRGKYVAYCDGDDWWSDPRKLQMQADLLESDPSCGMCYRAPATITRTPASPNPITRSTLPTSTTCFAGSPSPTAPRWRAATSSPATMPRCAPTSTPNGLPTTPRCGSGSRPAAVCATSRPSRVHRRLPQSVSHSTEYPRRIAFCDSLMDISLWFDARYGARRNRFRILRRRSSVALWVLSWNGSVGEYLARWRRDVAACPRLLFCPEGCGLLVKKILFRRKKQRL